MAQAKKQEQSGFGDLRNTMASYLDFQEVVKGSAKISTEISKKWLVYLNEHLQEILDSLTETEPTKAKKRFWSRERVAKSDDLEKAKDAFLKMLSESAKITDFTTDKIAKETSKQMVEGYSVGFAEGARQNSTLMIDAMRKLIANNYLDDTDGKIEKFLQITEKQTANAYKDMMQGKTMHLYNNPPKKNGNAKKS